MSFKHEFLEVYADLSKVSDTILLVGGWVPVVYFEYLWREKQAFLKTVDIDFALTKPITDTAKFYEIFNSRRYSRRHLRLGKEHPYQLLFHGKTPVDFLTDNHTSNAVKNKLIGGEVILNTVGNYHFLVTEFISVNCSGLNVRVPRASRYISHKLAVYLANPIQRKKDIAAVYFILSRSPQQQLILEELKMLKNEKIIRANQKKIATICKNKSAKAVMDVKEALKLGGMDEDSLDVYEVLSKLL